MDQKLDSKKEAQINVAESVHFKFPRAVHIHTQNLASLPYTAA